MLFSHIPLELFWQAFMPSTSFLSCVFMASRFSPSMESMMSTMAAAYQPMERSQ